jgi:LmbE family N-acetylglucosaminyl deacetylase
MKRASYAYHRVMNDSPNPQPDTKIDATTTQDRHKASMAAKAASQEARLKAALRDNLRRRKASDKPTADTD